MLKATMTVSDFANKMLVPIANGSPTLKIKCASTWMTVPQLTRNVQTVLVDKEIAQEV